MEIIDFDFKNSEHKLQIVHVDYTIRDVFVEKDFCQEMDEMDKTLKILSSLSEHEQERVASEISVRAERHPPNIYTIPFAWMKQMVELISSEKNEFFKEIDLAEEFGVSRIVGDKMNYLHRLLSNSKLDSSGNGAYVIHSQVQDSRGNAIGFEHRFRATSNQEADKLYEKISSRLSGVLLKILLACWKCAHRVQQFAFSCKLTELMRIVSPGRTAYFSTREKSNFFESLKSLEQTKFIFASAGKQKTRKKRTIKQQELHFLTITECIISEGNKYPNHISISLLDNHGALGKMAFVRAMFKNATLGLCEDDIYLASWIQIRANQSLEKECIMFPLRDLLRLSGLSPSTSSNVAHAKELLRKKLGRIVNAGIILDVPNLPKKLQEPVCLKVRQI